MKSIKDMKKRNERIKELNSDYYKKMQTNSRVHGITLVALVCTIVVLLILSGITITILFGENGIIKRAQDASDATKKSQANETEGLSNLEEQMIDAIYDGGKIEDWEYTLNEENEEVILNKYIGNSENINVKGSYTIGSNTYKTVIGQTTLASGETSGKGPFYTAKIGRENIKKIRIKGGVTVENNNAINMFNNCSTLKEVDINGLDTSNVRIMRGMFLGCSSLENLDISYLDGKSVETTAQMFSGCIRLENLKLPDFSSGNLKIVVQMFMDCRNLKEIDVSKINTTNLQPGNSMTAMFGRCIRLEKLDLSTWNLSNIQQMANTFHTCINLKEIDLSGSELSNLRVINGMFLNTRNLTKIYVKTENDKTKLTNLAGSGPLNLNNCNIIVKGETT